MACSLRPGNDVLGAVGATATVFVKSVDEPTMRITNATLDGTVLKVADGKVDLPALHAGNNVLDLIVIPSPTGADVTLTEDCKDTPAEPSRALKRKFIGGGDDPHVGYTIHA